MNITTILWTSAITLVGLQLCVTDGDVEKFADQNPRFWCPNPLLRVFYGLFQLIGAVFVIGCAIYLTFTEHWWYILVYLGGAILAKVVAFILQIPLTLIFSKQIQGMMYGGLVAKRIAGTILVFIGIIIFMALINS